MCVCVCVCVCIDYKFGTNTKVIRSNSKHSKNIIWSHLRAHNGQRNFYVIYRHPICKSFGVDKFQNQRGCRKANRRTFPTSRPSSGGYRIIKQILHCSIHYPLFGKFLYFLDPEHVSRGIFFLLTN